MKLTILNNNHRGSRSEAFRWVDMNVQRCKSFILTAYADDRGGKNVHLVVECEDTETDYKIMLTEVLRYAGAVTDIS